MISFPIHLPPIEVSTKIDTPDGLHKQVTTWVGLLSPVVVPALTTLVPAGIIALFKIMQNLSRSRRSEELTARINQLAKYIADLPASVADQGDGAIGPRAALQAELNLTVSELTALQSRVRHSFHEVSSTATARLRAALLLFRPKGLPAFTLHALFYLYDVAFLFTILAVIFGKDPSTGNTEFISTASASAFVTDALAFIFLVGVASIPPLVLHHCAIKIHRRQIASVRASELPAGAAIPASQRV
jgi:hypothetical protein